MEKKTQQYNMKKKLAAYAERIKRKMNQNNIIQTQVDALTDKIDTYRDLLMKYSKTIYTPHVLQKNIKGDFFSIIENLHAKNMKLVKENQLLEEKATNHSKVIERYDKLISEFNKKKEDNFLLENKIYELEGIYKKINDEYKSFKKSGVYSEKSKDIYIWDPIYSYNNVEYELEDQQNNLLSLSRSYNRKKKSVCASNKALKTLEESINMIKEETNPIIPANNGLTTTAESRTQQATHDKEVIINPIKEVFEGSDIFENTDIVINSDDDEPFEVKLCDNQKIRNVYIETMLKTIPKLDMKHIEYNKVQVKPEVDLLSLGKNDLEKSVESQIRLMNHKLKFVKMQRDEMKEKANKCKACFKEISKKVPQENMITLGPLFTIDDNQGNNYNNNRSQSHINQKKDKKVKRINLFSK